MEFKNTKKTMTTQQQSEQIVGLILKEFKNEEYYFDEAIKIKTSPHTPEIEVWAIAISPKGDIYLRTADGMWNKMEATDRNYDVVIASLYQRVSFLFGHRKATA